VEVRVHRAGTLTVEVEDDGTGMDTDAQTRGFGLPGMRERVEALGGTLHLSSGGGRGGVTLSVELPLMDASRHP
jgi:two-component system sensor histidine kinase UhpB